MARNRTTEKLEEFKTILKKLGGVEQSSERNFRITTNKPRVLEELFSAIEHHNANICQTGFSVALKNAYHFAGHTSYEVTITQTINNIPSKEYERAYYHFLSSTVSAAKRFIKP